MLGGIRIGGDAIGAAPLIGGSARAIIDRLGEYRDAGLHHLIATPRRADAGPPTPDAMIEDMHWLADDVLPALR